MPGLLAEMRTRQVAVEINLTSNEFILGVKGQAHPILLYRHAGVPFVMVSLATYTRIDSSHIAAFSPVVMRTILRGDLGFHGVVMSDSLSATAVSSVIPGSRAIRFLTAGGDRPGPATDRRGQGGGVAAGDRGFWIVRVASLGLAAEARDRR